MATTWSVVFPAQNTTSGWPWRSVRWWSMLANGKLLGGKMPQLLERRRGGEPTGRHLRQERAQPLGGHATCASGAR